MIVLDKSGLIIWIRAKYYLKVLVWRSCLLIAMQRSCKFVHILMFSCDVMWQDLGKIYHVLSCFLSWLSSFVPMGYQLLYIISILFQHFLTSLPFVRQKITAKVLNLCQECNEIFIFWNACWNSAKNALNALIITNWIYIRKVLKRCRECTERTEFGNSGSAKSI